MIDLYDFLSTKQIIHNDTITDYLDAIKFFIENKEQANMITYNYIKHFSICNVSILETDKEGNYFYEFSVERHGDIIDNIHFESPNINAQLTYYIGGIKYSPEEVNEFLIVSAPYHDFKIRVTFLEKPTFDDEFKILGRYYILDSPDRKLLAAEKVKTKNNIYNNGMCHRID